MARKSTTPQKPLGCPRIESGAVMDNLPSEAQTALQTPLEAPETASAGQGPAPRLNRGGSVAGVKNLTPFRDTETARERGRLGGLASAAARRKRKEVRAYLDVALKMDDEETGELNALVMSLAMVREAKKGNVRAFLAVLEALGEKPAQMLDLRSGDGSMTPAGRDLTALPIDQLMALARAEWGEDAGTAPAVEAQP